MIKPVAARIAPDLGLPDSIAPNDLALLDQNPLFRERPSQDACWVVGEAGDLRIRRVKLEGAGLLFANDSSTGELWRPIPLNEDDVHGPRGILGVVKARVVWIGREIPLGIRSAGPFD